MNLHKNEIFTVTIDDYSSTAQGVAHIDGLAVFVKGALVGEKVQVKLTKVTKKCAWARLHNVISASPARIKPDCPYYKTCGGCSTRHISYAEECGLKEKRVNDAMQRIGKLPLQVELFHAASQTTRYRNKTIFPVDGNKIGLFRERSHDVVDINSCLIQSKEADAAIVAVREWIEQYHVNCVRNIFVRTNYKGQALVCLVVSADKVPHKKELIGCITKYLPSVVGIVLNINTKNTNVVLGKHYLTIWGQDRIQDRLCGLDFELSIPSFFQINRAQTEVLYQRTIELASLSPKNTVVDLYCGIGTITLAMAQHAKHVTGIEVVPQAIRNAEKNAQLNHAENVHFVCADASDEDALNLLEQINADVVCVDPPRKGLTPALISRICAQDAQKVVYVSCNPATLARDLALFEERGYVTKHLEAVDMFPRTPHVECVALLSKRK